ncbi:UNVERIFIED_CONTAM: hypothetical protein HDU68_002535 [Siphonaria sp. JEL0065]|nr:hypothetical protein HDU68_002535 [Siphonaria sp. JEL0065]
MFSDHSSSPLPSMTDMYNDDAVRFLSKSVGVFTEEEGDEGEDGGEEGDAREMDGNSPKIEFPE